MTIAQLLPPQVIAVETRRDWDDAEPAPAELAALGQAVPTRRVEFATSRACARQALGRLGFGPVAVESGPGGEPRWPDGIVGSITHCEGYRACAVARSRDMLGLGIDAEPHAPLPDGVLEAIATADELRCVRDAARARPGIHWDRLLFSAKECAYKVWYPLARRRAGPEAIRVMLDPERERLQALLPAGCGLRRVQGRWMVSDGLLLAAALAPTHSARSARGRRPTSAVAL